VDGSLISLIKRWKCESVKNNGKLIFYYYVNLSLQLVQEIVYSSLCFTGAVLPDATDKANALQKLYLAKKKANLPFERSDSDSGSRRNRSATDRFQIQVEQKRQKVPPGSIKPGGKRGKANRKLNLNLSPRKSPAKMSEVTVIGN